MIQRFNAWLLWAGSAVFLVPACSSPVKVVDFDWDNPTNITNHEYWDFDPDYSPDGSQIAFHSNRPPSPKNRGQIYLMNSDGSNPRSLTNTENTNYGASWSPDGRQIAFTSERDGNSEVYVMNADGTAQRNLTNSPSTYDAGPDWSPDGRYIAYFSGSKKPDTDEYIPSGSAYRYWNADLYILDTQSGEVTQITFTDHDDIYPVWSHDGNKLAFTSSRDGNNEIYLINVDGTGLRRVTNNDRQDNAVAWMRDDRSLTFGAGEQVGEELRVNIYEANLATGKVTRVTDRAGTIYFNGHISPDGRTLAYAAFTVDEKAFNGERADIYVVRKLR